MGAMDFLDGLKGAALDQAHIVMIKHAYELQEKNVEQLERNNALLEKEIQRLEPEIKKLQEENENLIASGLNETEFHVTPEGFAFKKDSNDNYRPEPYCPKCHSVMGMTINFVYSCPSCKHMVKFRSVPSALLHNLGLLKEKDNQ